jgi:hypothetical protein
VRYIVAADRAFDATEDVEQLHPTLVSQWATNLGLM